MSKNNTVELDKMIDKAYKECDQCKSDMGRFVYADYLTQLHDLRGNILRRRDKVNWKRIFGSKDVVRRYDDFMDSLQRSVVLNYLQNKDFHKEYLGDILDIENNALEDLYSRQIGDFSKIPKEEFLEYILEFLKTYKVEGLFDKIVNNKRLFLSPLFYDASYSGECFYNPLTKDAGIDLCSFRPDLFYMSVLAHEFGHLFDLENFDYPNQGLSYLKYTYGTTNDEIMSVLFQKLFLDFMFEKKYLAEDTENLELFDLFEGRSRIMDAYLLSLLNEKTIIRGPKIFDDKALLKQVSPYFVSEDVLIEDLHESDLDPFDSQKYAYGEILGTILKEQVKGEGLNTALVKETLDRRTKPFSPNFISTNADADTYQKILVKDIERIKK